MTMFGEFMLRPWLRGLCFIEGTPDVGAGGAGGEAAVLPPDAMKEIPDTDNLGDTPVKSDYDILSEEDEPVKETPEGEPAKKEGEEEPEPVAAKTPEQIAAEKAAAATKTPEQVEAEKQAAAAEAPVKALKEAIDRDVNLKAALDKNPTFRNKIFIDARRSARLAQYTPHFATPEIAQQAATDLTFFNDFEQDFIKGTPDSSVSLLNRLLDADKVRDAAGNVLKDEATGLEKVNGNYARMITTYRMSALYPQLEENARRLAEYSPDEQKEFLDGEEFDADAFRVGINLMKRLMGDPIEEAKPAKVTTGGRAATNGKAAAFDETKLPDEQRRLLERGRKATESDTQGASEAEQQQATKVSEAISTSGKAAIGERVKAVGKAFTPEIQTKIIEDTWKELNAMAKKDTPYKRAINRIGNQYSGKEQIDRCSAFSTAYVKERMNDVIREVSKSYGAGAVAASADKHAELEAQKGNNREPKTQGGVSSPARRDEGELVRDCTKLFRQLHNRGPKDLEILGFDDEELGNLQRQVKALGR